MKDLFHSHSDLMETAFAEFFPKAEPIKPVKNDPLLLICCVCGAQAPHEFNGVAFARLCEEHHTAYICNGKFFTRESLCNTFGFSKKEADGIPHKSVVGGFYRSKIFAFQLTSVLRAVVKKYGSIYMMLRTRFGEDAD